MKKTSLEQLPAEAVSHNPQVTKKVLLDSQVIPGLTGFSQAVLRHGQVAPGHVHEEMFEVFFVRSGRARVVVDGSRHELSQGDCLVVEPGEHHEVGNPYREDLVLLYFGLCTTGKEVQA